MFRFVQEALCQKLSQVSSRETLTGWDELMSTSSLAHWPLVPGLFLPSLKPFAPLFALPPPPPPLPPSPIHPC